MRSILLISCSVLALGLPAVVHAAEASPAPAPDVAGAVAANAGAEVVVVANRSETPLALVGQSVTVLTLPQIRADQELVISDILARTPGVSFARNGGVGGVTSLFIRGADADQTLVLVDGVQINDPSAPAGGFDFANLLVGDVSRIEVLRGQQSTLYGSQAIGGVVNVVTADPTKPFQGDAQIEGGSYGTGYAKVGVGGLDGPWSWRLAANSYSTSGVSAFDKRFGGKEDDGYRNEGVSGRLGYAFAPDVSLDLRGLYVQARGKLDGYSTPTFSFGDDSEYEATRESVAYAGLNFGLLDDRLENRIAAQYTLTQRNSYDPAYAPTTRTFDGRGVNARIEYQGSYAITQGWQGVFGAQSQRESITTSSPAFSAPGTPPTKADATTNSVYGQLQAEPIHGLNLTGGLRYDDHSTFGGHTVGQVSGAYALNDGSTILRASWSQGFKAPTVYQLYSAYGNTALRPETSNGWDAGVEQKFWNDKIDLQATYFERSSHNLIDFTYCPSGSALCNDGRFGYYDNVDRARAKGVELSGAVHPLAGLDLTANYTWLDDENRSAGFNFGKDLVRRPDNTANASAVYVWPIKLSTTLAVRYAGASFDNASNSTRLKSYTLVDLRTSYPLSQGLEIYGRIENLFDKAYETAFKYGNPGRAGYVGLRAVF